MGTEAQPFNRVMHGLLTEQRPTHKAAERLFLQMSEHEACIRLTRETPQSPPFHSEGLWLSDHLLLMLTTLFSIWDGSFSLGGMEDVGPSASDRAHLERLVELIRDHRPFFEAFVLAHDLGKPIVFGVVTTDESLRSHPLDRDPSSATALRKAFSQEMRLFERAHRELPPPELAVEFFRSTGERCVTYHGHELVMQTPVFIATTERIARTCGVPENDLLLLRDVIFLHQELIRESEADSWSYRKIEGVVKRHKLDLSVFLEVLHAALFLDVVCGSRLWSKECGGYFDSSLLWRAFAAAQEAFPQLVERSQQTFRQRKEAYWSRWFREVELDGHALLKLLDASPGPAFGEWLREFQIAVRTKRPLPPFSPIYDKMLADRVARVSDQIPKEPTFPLCS